ncbi:bifunctional MitoNEET [Babesia duncani]|uniref:Bifunctional MitoNEET n=1 Tax=Babesia duncani TaxID=323732 RepID=A0AAD9UQU9_9APIC|nr:bifunctional MitoNEET [Babesia duncani]
MSRHYNHYIYIHIHLNSGIAFIYTMYDPLDYFDKINFNTKGFPKHSNVIEHFPSPNGPDKIIRLCRCWQSRKFPYCDDTHKLLIEAGDDVGPFVARITSEKTGRDNTIKFRNPADIKKQNYSSSLVRMTSPKLVLGGWFRVLEFRLLFFSTINRNVNGRIDSIQTNEFNILNVHVITHHTQ